MYIIALIPAVILLAQIRNLRYLVPFSTLANIFIVVGLAMTLYYVFTDLKPIEEVKYIASVGQLPKFFATVIFAIEGIGVVSFIFSYKFNIYDTILFCIILYFNSCLGDASGE